MADDIVAWFKAVRPAGAELQIPIANDLHCEARMETVENVGAWPVIPTSGLAKPREPRMTSVASASWLCSPLALDGLAQANRRQVDAAGSGE